MARDPLGLGLDGEYGSTVGIPTIVAAALEPDNPRFAGNRWTFEAEVAEGAVAAAQAARDERFARERGVI